jgi:2-C-methyl-D-erythritol 4-phosphate cytidylyltransferase
MNAVAAVISAAGSSSRMGGVKKEYRPLGLSETGEPLTVLGAAVSAFAAVECIGVIVIAVPAAGEWGEYAAREALPSRFRDPSGPGKRILFVPGGPTRRISVHHALSLLEAYHPPYVLIHDGARPWVGVSLIEATMAAVMRYRAALPLLPLTETPKEYEGGFVTRHLRRAAVGAAQTPQGFAFPEILRAHERAAERELADHAEYTDDAEIWGEFVGPVAVIPGAPENRKITFPEDLPCFA